MAEGSSSASELGCMVDVHVCLIWGMDWWALGHLGLHYFFIILAVLDEGKTQGHYKRILSCRPSSHQRSRHRGAVVLFCL